MTVFILLAAALVAGALLLVVPPLFGAGVGAHSRRARQRQAETALAVLREQLADLEAERTAGRVDEAEYARTREELERRALNEGEAGESPADARPARKWALALVICVPLLAGGVYLALGEPAGLDPQAVAGEDEHGISREQMAGLIAQLAERLAQQPQDPEGWAMLARSYALMQDFDSAAATWARIGAQAPADADVLADWADLLAAGSGRVSGGEAEGVVARALELDPEHIKARALAGTAAFERGDYAAASAHWERILARVPPGEQVAASVRASINEARSAGGMPLLEAPAAPAEGAKAAAGDDLKLAGEVRLAPALAAAAAAEDTVFVFVRPAAGGMPVAALRYRVADLPAKFDFAGVARMSEGPLPERLVVAARVSKSGDAMPRSGDLEGASAPLAPDAQGVGVVIDRTRP